DGLALLRRRARSARVVLHGAGPTRPGGPARLGGDFRTAGLPPADRRPRVRRHAPGPATAGGGSGGLGARWLETGRVPSVGGLPDGEAVGAGGKRVSEREVFCLLNDPRSRRERAGGVMRYVRRVAE